jgi:glycosyltransferase involved in cell wall biosynthesis
MNNPLLSIVIATYNSVDVLGNCLESLSAQRFRNFEVIIQDGASTDGTVALATSFAPALPRLEVESEADTGVYDAWNKVLSRLRGRWTLFLGGDDMLAGPDVLGCCAAVLVGLPPQVWYACGDVAYVYPDGSTVTHSGRAEGALRRMEERVPFCHSSLWHRTTLFAEHRFDPAFRIAADYDFICRTWTHDGMGHTLGFTVTFMGVGGLSTHPRYRLLTLWENTRIAKMHGYPVLTARRTVPLLKAILLWGVCACVGARGPALLDRLRLLRGLTPCWTTQAPPLMGKTDDKG